ncbi:MAG: sugar ABC transporter substrate-binding protein [Lachnospiraceae bacterium]|nr:sugar ABC transporter substrate-binding protein [Lachnospiraceae bacterium]
MKKKVLAVLLASAMVASLAGCGNSSSEAPAETAGTEETTEGAEEAPAADEGAEEAPATEEEAITATITVWGPSEDQSADAGNWLPTMCEQFAAQHPNWDLTFQYGVCAEGDAKATVTQDVEGAADVYMLANDNIPDLVAANAIAELGGSYLDAVTSVNADSIVASVTYNDSVWAFPFTSNTWFMFYDKSVFTEDDIKSLDTMLEKGKVSFPLSNSWYIQAFYVANGGTIFGDGTDEAAGINLGGENGAAATDYLVDLVANPNFINDQDGAGMAGLRDGSVNVLFSGTWDAESVKEALGDNMGVAALPTANIGGTEGQLKSFMGSKAIAVNPNTEYMEVSMALAAYLASEEAQQAHYDLRNVLPTNINISLSDDAVATAVTNTMTTSSIMQPVVSAMGNYWSPAENMGKALVAGEITHDNAAEKTEEMNTAMNTDVAQ